MTMIKKMALSLTAVSMAVAPIAASAAQTAQLRALSTQEEASEMETGTWLWILALIAAIVGGVALIGKNSPTSP